jgi:Spy/CpxP family protein refolding chaperone
MMTTRRLVMSLVVAGLMAAPALAQRPGGGGFGGGFGGNDALSLLGQKSVQEELKLTEDQIKKATEARDKLRPQRPAGGGTGQRPSAEEMRAAAEERRKNVEKALGEFLKPEQQKRLDQIALQQTEKNMGLSAALRNPKVADALKLTDDQKELLKAIGEDQQKLFQEAFAGGGGGNREENQKKMADFRKTANEKITKSFSDTQKATWKDLVGAEFTGKIEPPMPRRPGGGGR